MKKNKNNDYDYLNEMRKKAYEAKYKMFNLSYGNMKNPYVSEEVTKMANEVWNSYSIIFRYIDELEKKMGFCNE